MIPSHDVMMPSHDAMNLNCIPKGTRAFRLPIGDRGDWGAVVLNLAVVNHRSATARTTVVECLTTAFNITTPLAPRVTLVAHTRSAVSTFFCFRPTFLTSETTRTESAAFANPAFAIGTDSAFLVARNMGFANHLCAVLLVTASNDVGTLTLRALPRVFLGSFATKHFTAEVPNVEVALWKRDLLVSLPFVFDGTIQGP
jgi:hypothetical protein